MYESPAHLGRPRRRKMVRVLQSRLELCAVKQSLRLGQQHTARLSRDEIVHAGVHQHHGAIFYGLDQCSDLSNHRSASLPQGICVLVLHVDFTYYWSASVELVLEAREVRL